MTVVNTERMRMSGLVYLRTMIHTMQVTAHALES